MIYNRVALSALALLAPAAAQQPGTLKVRELRTARARRRSSRPLAALSPRWSHARLQEENHPSLSVSTCTVSGGCVSASKSVTIDSNWRWLHQTGAPNNCYEGNLWDPTLCPDEETCQANCALEGADEEYQATYGINATGDSLGLGFVTNGTYSLNVGSRTYLMEDDEHYKMFKLKNKEARARATHVLPTRASRAVHVALRVAAPRSSPSRTRAHAPRPLLDGALGMQFTFDVDVSKLPCGLNGALYFVQMDADGGKAKYPTNTAGAKYGTGYCDAQW